jgi:predicted nuclease of predicted toxin-antitoxin system
MPLLVDENVPESVTEFFAERGHQITRVRDVFPNSTPDQVIAAIGNRDSQIVVTWDKDFRGIVSRAPKGVGASLRRLGRISFRCSESKGRERITSVIDVVEFEYEQAQKRRDKRIIIEITETNVRTVR